MYNILGPKNFKGEYKPVNIVPEKGVFLKMYGKKESNPKRKLGHLNVVDLDNSGNIDFLLNKLEKIKKLLRKQEKHRFHWRVKVKRYEYRRRTTHRTFLLWP